MTKAEAYLRELRLALPIGCRRRFVAEMREHFESAVAAEAALGVERAEAERLTIERLGPAQALADQLLADLRSGALGRVGRLAVAVTVKRLIAVFAMLAIAVVAGVFAIAPRSSSPAPPHEQAVGPTKTLVVINPTTGTVRRLIFRLSTRLGAKYTPPGPRALDGEFLLLHPVYLPRVERLRR